MDLMKDAILADMDCNGYLLDGFPLSMEQGMYFEMTVYNSFQIISAGRCYLESVSFHHIICMPYCLG